MKISQPELVQSPNRSSVSSVGLTALVNTCAEKFVAKLYGNPRLPRNLVQTIIDDLEGFFGGGFVEIVKSEVLQTLSESSETKVTKQNRIDEIERMFNKLENPFKDLRSEHLRFKHFENSGYYIAPVSYIIGETKPPKASSSGVQETDLKITGQFIPLRQTLKQFFELPNALSDTLAYMNSLSKTAMIENFVQGELWAAKRSRYSQSDIVLPIFIFFDDVEVNNPLGHHSGKLGSVYGSIACLPPECRSALKNLFLILLFESHARATYKNVNVLKPLILELIYLETEGITINSTQGPQHIYFVTGLILGDNLGLNGLLDFVESFSENYFCSICKMSKTDSQSTTTILPEMLRDKINYETDLMINDYSMTGIKARSVFNDFPSFHVCTNFAVDEIHDIREGLAHYDMLPVIRALTAGKYKEFDLETLNNRVLMFHYGPIDCSNKPPYISEHSLKKKNRKLKMTATEMLCFVKLFGVIVGDLVSSTNRFWKLYILLRQILDIALAKRLSGNIALILKVLIEEHHQLYIDLTKETLKPKFHIFDHSPEIFLQSGPLSNLSSIRFEARHRELIGPASVNMCRANICHSVAVKNQLSMCYRFLENESILPTMLVGSATVLKLDATVRFYSLLPSEIRDIGEWVSVNWVEYKGTTFKPKMFLIIGAEDLTPIFGEITNVLVFNQMPDSPIFICNCYTTLGLNDHVLGYEVELTREQVSVKPRDLLDPLPVYAYMMANGERYIILRYSI